MLQWVRDSPFTTATWIDWLDILLLAVVIYRVLLVIRGTRAMQSLVGLLLLLLLYIVAQLSGLSTFQWILDNLFVYLALGLLILFQDQIRSALATAGGSFLTRSSVVQADSKMLQEVIAASFTLASKRIGALIVLEGRASLDAFIEGSHQVDSLVRQALLQSIFHPASPMHDGAVVIRDGRIAAAGAFLPISLSSKLSRSFGTRHRAAIGLTENTDAICIVVSEERGTVSIATGGRLIPVVDRNDLRQVLSEQLSRPTEGEETAVA